jgi:DNA-binding NarL/FixJ family response regulator
LARQPRRILPPKPSAWIHRFNPDVVILDLGIDGNELAGLDLIGRLRAASKAAVLVFSMHRDPIIVSRS